ncbi:MAG: radical SAM protein [Spirochaetaceae bacterium]|nr:radical SAM protein [Spirochaetaceae bacterium]
MIDAGTVENHRSREGGLMVYPVYSRRSGGISIGINLFPDRKVCSFDCPYCEVFPFETDVQFHLETMEAALYSAIMELRNPGAEKDGNIRDICFSGNGEPAMSPHFEKALAAAGALRDKLVPAAKLVLISNGTALEDPGIFELLRNAAAKNGSSPGARGLHIWLKLDAGTEAWYHAMNRSDFSFSALISRIRDFAGSGAPFTIQTMVCRIRNIPPPAEEEAAWLELVTDIARIAAKAGPEPRRENVFGPGLRGVQIYGKARPAPEDPLARAVPAAALENRSKLLRAALRRAGIALPVEVYP